MAVPKKRHTKSRRNKRRLNLALKKVGLSRCQKCKEVVLPHHYCSSCGTYNGREIVDVMAKLSKKEKKQKQKEMSKKEEETKGKSKKPLNLEELSRK